MLMNQCCFNVDIWLKGKFESRHVHQRFKNSIERTLSIFIVLMFTRKWCSITKQIKFSGINHVFLLYKNIIKLLVQL